MFSYEELTTNLDWRHIVLAILVVLLFLLLIWTLWKGWSYPSYELPLYQKSHRTPWNDSLSKPKKPHKSPSYPKKQKIAANEDRVITRQKCSKGERECRRVLEKIFQAPFPTVEPWWLINPATGERLEIDAYNKEIGIGLEYHGKQHYNQESFAQTDEQFASQNARDDVKFRLCQENDVYLIIVPYTVPLEQIEEYITYYLPWNRKTRLDNGMTE